VNWAMAICLAALFGALAGDVVARTSAQPALVIVCETGGVGSDISHIASGANCVLHDRYGSATSAGAISVYDDSTGPGP
jgi:hypothetical protein